MITGERHTSLASAIAAGGRAARVGFDWDAAFPALDKVAEETDELRNAIEFETPAAVAEELGDLLFAVCNVARKLEIDPDAALRAAVQKFEFRFNLVLEQVQAAGERPQDLSLDELEAHWVAAKKASANVGSAT